MEKEEKNPSGGLGEWICKCKKNINLLKWYVGFSNPFPLIPQVILSIHGSLPFPLLERTGFVGKKTLSFSI